MTRQKNGTGRGRTVGYARVSTLEQDLGLQVAALQAQGCPDELIFVDKASGAKAARPGLTQCLETLHAGGSLVGLAAGSLGAVDGALGGVGGGVAGAGHRVSVGLRWGD